MPKGKYRFNQESLTYEKINHSTRKIILLIISYFSIFVTIGFAFMFVWLHFFPSAREYSLIEENKILRSQYKILDEKINRVELVMNDIADRDNSIYRVVFEADPIPLEVRNAGFGGVNRYQELQNTPNMELVVDVSKRIDILQKKLYIQSLSFDTIMNLAKNKTEMLKCIPAIQPLRNGNLVSGFGFRMHPIYKTIRIHTGIDLAAPTGTKIYATGDGIVQNADIERGYGKQVIINHGYNFLTVYGHMDKILVQKNQNVKRGDLIGLVGNTGTSTGSHLHYEVRRNNTPVNPINYYLNDLSPQEFAELLAQSQQTNQSLD
ncbi:MAG: M23 family metallopeptidase [Bacteroidales bacterium]|jgi:murein DD-endopeptidase MepM/ murein hydrolase activator NlpD|nr:M23 family metallopeptidase [Bacteroidales bacterium]